MRRTALPRKRKTPRVIHPERSGSHNRIRLYGKAKEKRRAEIFARAGGRCEEMIPVDWRNVVAKLMGIDHTVTRCPNKPTEWSHKRHGANKCDCLECGIASCSDCHRKRHNAGGKPCPKKPSEITREIPLKVGE